MQDQLTTLPDWAQRDIPHKLPQPCAAPLCREPAPILYRGHEPCCPQHFRLLIAIDAKEASGDQRD